MQGLNFKKLAFFASGLVLVVVFSAFLVNKSMHDPRIFAPVMTFDAEKLDLGDVAMGPQVSGEFLFRNTGQNVLVIKSIKPSCGCTGVILDEKKEYLPGEAGKVKFTFNTEGRAGKNEKTITIETNDPKTSMKTVSFSCNVANPPAK
jgi:hypothetical protein